MPDPGRIWRDQPEEEVIVNLEQIVNRRTQELSARSRSEILISLGSALFLVVIVAWRWDIGQDPWIGFALAAALAWVAISVYSFRRRIFQRVAMAPDAVAASCLDYYRQELERRRRHLRNAWLWHGPLLLAIAILLAILMEGGGIIFLPLRKILLLLLLLAAWVAFGIWRRNLQARSLQRQIEELDDSDR